ncbi:MAG: bacillithiol biosynthesis deacetylase BshB1 [Thermoanaerobaculia bacterium]
MTARGIDAGAIDILAVGAHPDDVELGCGGALMSLAARGYRFAILDLTRGEAGTRGTPEGRAREKAEAARLLGAHARESLDLGDGNLRTDRAAELEVIEVVRRLRPRLVFAPLAFDRHPDHLRTARLVHDASFYAGLASLRTEHPAHRPQHIVSYLSSFFASPTFLIDVTSVFARKLEALKAYRSQFHDPASTEPETYIATEGFLDGVTTRAASFGRMGGVRFAEGFVSALPPRLADPVAAFEGLEPGYPAVGRERA